MKKIQLLVIPLLLLAAAGGALYFKLIPSLPGYFTSAQASTTSNPALIDYPMTERVVNLADTDGFRYVKIQVTLEFADPKHRPGEVTGDALKQEESDLSQSIQPYQPSLDDFLITTLSRKTSADLLTDSGKEELRQQLLEGIRQRVPSPSLREVYFTDFVIQ